MKRWSSLRLRSTSETAIDAFNKTPHPPIRPEYPKNFVKGISQKFYFISKDEWLFSLPDLNPMDYSVWAILESKANAKAHKNLKLGHFKKHEKHSTVKLYVPS